YVAGGTVPAVPTNVTATATAYNKINVAWKDNSNNETGFELYRATSATGNYSIVATAAANAIAFTDTTLSPSTTYYYKIQAINKYGNSGLSKQDTTASSSNGLNYSYYNGSWSVLPNFLALTPAKKGVSTNTDITVATQSTNYGFLWQGYINITKAGSYTFGTTSDDGSDLWFNSLTPTGTPTVNNDGAHSSTSKTSSAITISVGKYPICIEFFQASGGANMSATYKIPNGSSQVTIPNSALYQLSFTTIPSATTFALPATPLAPANFKATATVISQIALSWNTTANATGYQLLRSIGDSSNYRLLTTLASSNTSYLDTGLNANLTHYYKLKATGAGGTISAASVAFATTKDNLPVITQLSSIAVPFSTSTTIAVNATDADGDALTYTASNLPAFASLANNGNGASLILNPSATDLGFYSNIKIVVNDGNGGKDSTQFTLTVNNNYAPTIDTIFNYTMNENDVVNIPLTAHDQNSGDVLAFSVSNAPNAYTLTDNGNGTATLQLHPNYLAAGTYNPVITVNDGNGGITTRTFNVVVNNASPNTNVYVRFQYVDTIGAPWNSITQSVTNNLKDASGAVTNIGLAVQGSWFTTFNTGTPTGNNSGVYPDAVLEDYLYFGIFGGPETLDTKITGLDTSKTYNLTFFASSVFPGTPDNGSTIYTVGNVSDTLYVQANTKNTVTMHNVKPASDGTITYTMSKNIDASVGYINSLVINYTYDDGTIPAAATSLAAQNISGKGVQLTWTDVAYNETGYNVYRALTSNSVYTLVGQTGADGVTYTDSSVNGNTQYSYKINAYNTHGVSDYSNVATITTINNVPKLTPISDVALKNNQTATVNIVAKDDSTDHVTLTVSGLPSFATFVDKGNGTGTITIKPTINNLGAYPVTVTATDNAGASASTVFNILVSDPNISSTYLSFSDGSHAVPKPWNMLAGYPFPGTTFTNINDDSNTPTGMTVKFKNGFSGVVQSGMQPTEGAGIYPNVVMRTAEFEQGNNKDTIQISGLSSSKKYNFVFFNSHDDGLVGKTNFVIGSTTVTLNATDNISKTVQINGVVPTNGVVNIVVSKVTGADYAFISSLIIQSYASNYTSLSPTNLRTTTVTRNSIGLQWEDRSYSETGYQVWRAADSVSSYTLLTTVAAGTTSYTDANLATNKTYNYAVRAVLGSNSYSSYSNTIQASTYSYSVYLNYNAGSDYALLPWNNVDAIPQIGYTWNNFFDEKGFTTSTGMLLTSNWAGMYNAGMNPLNNSGAVPDTVMIDSYGLFPGQIATFQVTGLNIGMKYDFTFFASSQAYGDVNVAYTINGVTTLLNASLNVNGTETIYNVTPDNYGNVTITVAAATTTSQFGLLGGLIIGAHTPSVSSVVPTLPGGQSLQSKSVSSAIANQDKPVNTDGDIKAFPNPFHDYFTLNIPSETKGRIQVAIYDITGKLVYNNNVGNVQEGMNTFKITPGSNLSAGIYTVIVINADTKTTKTIRLMKE
ncbi:MAG: fibronectin type III domain-containing protein, partial [Ginsengibacter sp.]